MDLVEFYRRWWRWINAAPANLAVGSTAKPPPRRPAVTGLAGEGRADQIGVWRHDVERRLLAEGVAAERVELEASLVKAAFSRLVMDLLATGDRRRLTGRARPGCGASPSRSPRPLTSDTLVLFHEGEQFHDVEPFETCGRGDPRTTTATNSAPRSDLSAGTATSRCRSSPDRSSATAASAPASWDEALTRAADGFRRGLRDRRGPNAVGVFSCSKSTNEMNFVAQKFRSRRDRHEQHRLVQPHLTRSLGGQSGHRLRAGGGTSSYAEIEEADVGGDPPWGSNARNARDLLPASLKAVRMTRLYVVDPRRSETAAVGRPVARQPRRDRHRAVAHDREIIHAGLASTDFIGEPRRAGRVSTATVEEVDAREAARPSRASPPARSASWRRVCDRRPWCAGRSAASPSTTTVSTATARPDQPRPALRSRGAPRRQAQPVARPEQRAGRRRHGSDPEPTRRVQDILDPDVRERFGSAWGSPSRTATAGTSQMFEAMERGDLRAVYVIGENPAQSEADKEHTVELLEGLDHLVVPGHLPHAHRRTRRRRAARQRLVVRERGARSPTANAGCNALARRSIRPTVPATTSRSSSTCVAASATTGSTATHRDVAEAVWDEVRSLSPMHAGMSYARLEAERHPVAVPARRPAGTLVPARPAVGRRPGRARPARPFSPVVDDPPVEGLSEALRSD
ncbi:MAG: hypothetical protein R2713_20865 [Ilumatobacteraceae bacterium]